MAVAVLAAALAGYLALNMTRQPAVVAEAPEKIVEKMPTVEILVAKQSMPVGARLNEEFLEWKGWPEDALVDGPAVDPVGVPVHDLIQPKSLVNTPVV